MRISPKGNFVDCLTISVISNVDLVRDERIHIIFKANKYKHINKRLNSLQQHSKL
nr:MAG TPA: hypothetical protein [Crassvirales sp.]